MKTSLFHICSIQTGLFSKTVASGEIVYLQGKHFDENGKIKTALRPDLPADFITEKHFLKTGDVLFAAKGTKNFAAVYESNGHPCVASTTFFVIRVQEKIILPEYLVWFLNHPATKKNLKSQAIGTALQSISKAVLQELEISIPPIETQRAILKIHSLQQQEQNIQKQMEDLKEKYTQQLLLNAIKS